MHQLCGLALAALLALAPSADALYTKTGPVVQLDAKNFKKEVLQSNNAVIVEFYAPWCGHCKNLKPAYEKAAKSLKGLAKVAAIDCDDDANKPTCGQYGVQGFPTLKTFKPTAKKGKPIVEDYQGQRTAKAIVDAVIAKIPNHVTRVEASGLDGFLATKNESTKALLFTNKGTSPPMWKSLAVDFLGNIQFAQIRDKEKAAVDAFGITKFPTVVLLPGGDKEGVVYEGKMEKEELVKFMETVQPRTAEPEPSAAAGAKKEKKAEKKKESTEKKADSSTSSEAEAAAPSEKPKPELRTLSAEELASTCFSPKSKACVLLFGAVPGAEEAHEKVAARPPPYAFRFFKPEDAAAAETLAKLGLPADKPAVVVANAHRGWWRLYAGDVGSGADVVVWLDAVQMGEGAKEKLPAGMVPEEVAEKVEKVEEALEEERAKDEEEEKAKEHDEL